MFLIYYIFLYRIDLYNLYQQVKLTLTQLDNNHEKGNSKTTTNKYYRINITLQKKTMGIMNNKNKKTKEENIKKIESKPYKTFKNRKEKEEISRPASRLPHLAILC